MEPSKTINNSAIKGKETKKKTIQSLVDSYLKSEKQKTEFAEWVLRHWQNYFPNIPITTNNFYEVYEQIAENLPISPLQFLEIFIAIPSIRKGLGRIKDTDLSLLEETTSGYHKGEVSLKEIGHQLGGISKTTAMNISVKGVDKLNKAMTEFGKIFAQKVTNAEVLDLNAVVEEVDQTIYNMATIWARIFVEEIKVESFLEKLQNLGIISKDDILEMKPEELQLLKDISLFANPTDQDTVKLLLINDIDKGPNNILKSFQTSISRRFHKKV